MKTFIQSWTTNERMAIWLPLGGFKLMWWSLLGAAVADLYVSPTMYDNMGNLKPESETVHISVYLWLLAIAFLGLGSAWGRAKAYAAAPSRLAHLAKGFTTVSVIASLIVGSVFGIGTFMSALTSNTAIQHDLVIRLLGVYVPIILDALLLVAIILWSFVGKGEVDEN
ncbi:MAG: hypothetical protein RL556_309 [Actinomycetota bacterium]|jgi:hypothetical protein